MAEIKGFKGIRYNENLQTDISKLVCPPYDAISESQRKEYMSSSEYNIVRLELPVGDDRYSIAGEIYRKWRKDGVLVSDSEDCVYIYELIFSTNDVKKSVKGLVCAVRLEDFDKRIILPHERTLTWAKTDRFELITSTQASFSQIYSMYMDDDSITTNRLNKLSEGKPDIEVVDDNGTAHRMWIVSDKSEIDALTKDFAERQLYIADGHHRYETALNYKKKLQIENPDFTIDDAANYTMMFLVDMDSRGLVVFPTHRQVKNLGDFDVKKTLEAINKDFNIEKRKDLENIETVLSSSKEEHTFGFYTGGDCYYILTLRDIDNVKKYCIDMSDGYCGLDVTILHTLIFENIFNITKADFSKQNKISYTRSIDEALTGVKDENFDCCFLLNPTKVTQIKNVAKAGEKMPQKSTYFYPKPITGLVFLNLE